MGGEVERGRFSEWGYEGECAACVGGEEDLVGSTTLLILTGCHIG